MVAKSYQGKEIVGEPYSVYVKSRGEVQYIKIKTGRTNPDGTPIVKEVRWYSEDEYYKMYPDEASVIQYDPKVVFGFQNGFIWIFKGNTYENLDWFKQCTVTRYARHFGWYVVSTEELPKDLPDGISAIKLAWETICDGNGNMLPEEQVTSIVRNILNPPNIESRYQGEVGEKLRVTAKCVSTRTVASAFGASNLHNFVDDNNNIYIWFTQAKNLTPNVYYSFDCKVKDHKEYRGQQQTIIYYLRNIKEVEHV